jgi:TonB-dependent starch-binding outer membrane protein SusC
MRELFNEIKKFPQRGFSCVRGLLMFVLLMISLPGFSQNITVKGTVTDAQTGETMIGLNVVIKGTLRGVITDLDGVYTIPNCPPDATLVFTYVGYEQLEIPVGGRTTVDAAIKPSSSMLDEVVVIGYGTVNRKNLMGSVTSVQGKDLARIPVASAAEAITGKMAGVQVLTTEGSPDAEVSIRIRGGGSITQSNSPLYIVDGTPVSSISDISPTSIQSMDVMKDASSTAIYGARGANGVIFITTKKAAEGKTRVSYGAYYGFKKVENRLNTISIPDYVKWQYEYAMLSDNLTNYEKVFGKYQDIDLFDGKTGTNWFDQIFGHIGTTFNQDLSINGGSDKFRFMFSYGGINSDEIMLNSSYKRDNLALKLDHNPNKRVAISFNFRYSDTKVLGAGGIDQGNATPTDARLRQAMIYPEIPLTSLGDYEDEEITSAMVNPIKSVYDNDKRLFKKRFSMGGSVSWDIIDNLQLKTEEGLEYYTTNNDNFYGLTTYYVKNTPATAYQKMPALETTESKYNTVRSTNTLNYDFKNILNNENHTVKLLLGQEVIITNSNTMFDQVWGFPTYFTAEDAYKLSSMGFTNSFTNTLNPDDKLLSFFGRFSYDYKNKYSFVATYRADGSSKFARGKRWGYFPSASVAWKLSEEEFMKSISSTVDLLKLRFSYGVAGNNNIPSNQIAQVFTSSTTTYINGATQIWSPSSVMANPDLKWESTYTRNLGLDFGLFRDRVNGSVEVYYNSTKDLLLNFPTSGTGYVSQYRNIGETENKGIELTINTVIIDKEKFGLNFGFNMSINKGKIVSLGTMKDFTQASSWASTEITADYMVAKGGRVGQMYGYKCDGRYEVSDFEGYDEATDTWTLKAGIPTDASIVGAVRPGTIKLKDLVGEDNNVTIDDCSVIGDFNPKNTGGFSFEGRLYDFDFSAVFSWSYGFDVYNANKVEFTTSRFQFTNMIDIMAEGKRWNNLDAATGEIVNDPATLEAMNANTTMWSPYMTRRLCTDWAVEDGSYLRLNTLSVGYNVPSDLLKRIYVQSLRLYATANNVFILTNYSGMDPEVSARRNNILTPGMDFSAYPKSRQIIFGVNLTF